MQSMRHFTKSTEIFMKFLDRYQTILRHWFPTENWWVTQHFATKNTAIMTFRYRWFIKTFFDIRYEFEVELSKVIRLNTTYNINAIYTGLSALRQMHDTGARASLTTNILGTVQQEEYASNCAASGRRRRGRIVDGLDDSTRQITQHMVEN